MRTWLLALGVWGLTFGSAQANFQQVNLSALVNADLTTYTGGASYPQHGGPLIVAGIPLTLATIPPLSNTAVIQASTVLGETQTYSIPVGAAGVTTVYTLINTAFGSCGTNVGELVFVGSHNTFTYTLTEGVNVRDHFNGEFCNTVTSVAGTATFGEDRLDMQQIILPPGFATDTLQHIDFNSFGEAASGSPFVAAVTVAASQPIPVLSPWMLMVLCIALCGLGIAFWRQPIRRDAKD